MSFPLTDLTHHLSTRQELFRQHSPGDRFEGGSGEPSPVRGDDVAARLQGKLEEWQSRLESAAKLRSAEGAAARTAESDPWHSAAGGGWGDERGDVVGAGPGLRAAHASQVLAAIEAAASRRCSEVGDDVADDCDDGVGTPTSGSPASTAVHGSATHGWERSSPASPRIPAVRQASVSLAASPTKTPHRGPPRAAAQLPSPLERQAQQQQVWRDNPLAASRPSSCAGSRIKQLGLQAASSPVQQSRHLPLEQGVVSSTAASPARPPASTGKLQATRPVSLAASHPKSPTEGTSADGSSKFATDSARQLSTKLNLRSPPRPARHDAAPLEEAA